MKKSLPLLLAMLLSVCTALLCWGSVSRAALSAFAPDAAPPSQQQPEISFTTAKQVGDMITLRINSEGDFQVEGATFTDTIYKDGRPFLQFKVANQNITIKGNVTDFTCNQNLLTELNISKNDLLVSLNCQDNHLTSLDVSKNTQLKTLWCYGNQLMSLDISENTKLIFLNCGYNQLTSLDVSKNGELDYINLQVNHIASLDLSRNTKLQELICNSNLLTSLDVSKNTKLVSLDCNSNELTSLDVSKNTKLENLKCANNDINGASMDQLVQSLSQTAGGYLWTINRDGDNNVMTKSQVKIAQEKGWKVWDGYGNVYESIGDETPAPSNVGKGIIAFTTAKAVGDNIALRIEAQGDFQVEGATFADTIYRDGVPYLSYRVDSQDIAIKGDVRTLVCKYNAITHLDASKNPLLTELYCNYNRISNLDVSPNTQLTVLDCGSNNLTNLDVSKNTQLSALSCSKNKLKSLDVSKNRLRKYLHCAGNQLTSLDVSNQTQLAGLNCANNQLKSLNVSNDTLLRYIDCAANQLTSVDISKNKQLTELYCYNNQLTSLDVSNNKYLLFLECFNNSIKGVEMSKLVQSLPHNPYGKLKIASNYREDNVITKSQVKVATDKGWIVFDSNEKLYPGIGDETPAPSNVGEGIITFTTAKAVGDTITLHIKAEGDFQVEGATFIDTLEVVNNRPFLQYKVDKQYITIKGDVINLVCRNNEIVSLDVSKNTQLRELYCDNNELTSLDVSKNTELFVLGCNNNQFTSFDVSKNTQLLRLDCFRNQLTSLDVSKNTQLLRLDCDNNQLTSLDVSKNTLLARLACEYNPLTSLDVSKNTQLQILYCDSNQLTSLDVSKNTQLAELNCNENQLTRLDISKNTQLGFLACSDNQLTNLDISKNPKLETLYCSDNQLTSLDISKNTQLGFLSCYYNQLTNLDVSNNTQLKYLICYNNAIKGAAMEQLVQSLPQTEEGSFYVFNRNGDNNVITKSQVKTATDKGWKVLASNHKPYPGIDDETPAPSNVGEGIITFTTAKAVGDTITLGIQAEGDFQVDGATFVDSLDDNVGQQLRRYKVDQQNITIKGDVTVFKCNKNQLTNLDVSKNTKLQELLCSMNFLTTLDISKNTKISTVQCWSNRLTEINVSANNTELRYLGCRFNSIQGMAMSKLVEGLPQVKEEAKIRISGFPSLPIPSIHYEGENSIITKSQVKIAREKGWTIVAGDSDTPYEGIDDALPYYRNIGEGVITLTTSASAIQFGIKAEGDFLVEGAILAYMNGSAPVYRVTSPNITIKGNVTSFDCTKQKITSLDVSKNIHLTELYCSQNRITNLDVSKNTQLIELNCHGNAIKDAAMEQLVQSLPRTDKGTLRVIWRWDYVHPEENVITKAQVKVATDKGWKVLDDKFLPYPGIGDETPAPSNVGEGIITFTTAKAVGDTITLHIKAEGDFQVEGATFADTIYKDGVPYLKYMVDQQDITIKGDVTKFDCRSNEIVSLDVSKNTQLEELVCFLNQLTSLDVSKNTQLRAFNCRSNQLTSLDVSKNTKLQRLFCYSNQLISLDVSKNTQLEEFSCLNNQLTSLDVSKNTQLKKFSCAWNQLSSLDVSKNTQLAGLYCSSNLLTSLDVSKNTELTLLHCTNNDIKDAAMEQLVRSLPQTEKGDFKVFDRDGDNNVITKAQVKVATDKGWKVLITATVPYLGIGNDRLSFTTNKAVGDSITFYVGIDSIGEGFRITEGTQLSKNVIQDGKLHRFVYRIERPNQTFTIEGDIAQFICRNSGITSIETFRSDNARRMQHSTIRTLNAVNEVLATAQNLRVLDVTGNLLTALSLQQMPKLEVVRCANNQLSSLSLQQQTALKELSCEGNHIRGEKMDALIASLPKGTANNLRFVVVGANEDPKLGNHISVEQVEKVTEKGWSALQNKAEDATSPELPADNGSANNDTTEPYEGNTVPVGISSTSSNAAPLEMYDLSGRRVPSSRARGVTILRQGGRTTKVVR